MDYKDKTEIANFFSEITGLQCEFMRTKNTLFLSLDNGKYIFSHPRKGCSEYTKDEVKEIFLDKVKEIKEIKENKTKEQNV
jgi:hypothetical protein